MRALYLLSNHRWLKAIRTGFVLLMPVVFIGAIALFLGSFPFSVLMPQMAQAFGHDWSPFAMRVLNASTGILALCIVLLVSDYLAVDIRERQIVELSPSMVVSVALVNFFLVLLFSGERFEFAVLG
jgi:PTS system cellobiose-specific IIC component